MELDAEGVVEVEEPVPGTPSTRPNLERVDVFHAGRAVFTVGVVGGEQVVLANEAVEGGLGDAVGLQEALLDAEAIDGPLVGVQAAEVRLGGVDRFEEFLGRGLAGLALVAAASGASCR